jgi:heavy metal response regulator
MRLLVVEDNPKVAQFIVKGLREEGYAVDLAERGDEAVTLTRLTDYDLIVLDLLLPRMDGLEVTRTLRGAGNPVPILMLTARGGVEDRIRGLEEGADDYLTKPFAFAELVARVRALLRRSQGTPETTLRIADLVVDPVTRSVSRGDRQIELTAREYALLDFLLRNQNRVLTRTAIVEHVWDMNFDSDTNLVDVYISHLRRKIDDDSSCRLIHTVRGVGYVMRVD